MGFRQVGEHVLTEGFASLAIIIIMMEICKASTLSLKALSKHSITHMMYIEMEMLSAIKMYIRKKKIKEHIM